MSGPWSSALHRNAGNEMFDLARLKNSIFDDPVCYCMNNIAWFQWKNYCTFDGVTLVV